MLGNRSYDIPIRITAENTTGFLFRVFSMLCQEDDIPKIVLVAMNKKYAVHRPRISRTKIHMSQSPAVRNVMKISPMKAKNP